MDYRYHVADWWYCVRGILKNDLCVIKYSKTNKENKKDKTWRYFIFKITSENKAYVAETTERYLYDFYTIDTRGLNIAKSLYTSALSTNIFFYKLTTENSKILIHNDLCFDTIDSNIWENRLKDVEEDVKNAMAEKMDIQQHYSDWSTDQKFQDIFKYLEGRYIANEQNDAINIIYANGLKSFAKRGYISDLGLTITPKNEDEQYILGKKIAFNKDIIKQILEFIQNRIGNPKKGIQKFYLIKPIYSKPKVIFALYRNAALTTSAPESLHKLDSETTWNDVEIVNAIYDYISDQLLKSKGKLDSIIMDDDEARNYIDNIKKELDEVKTNKY